MKTNSSVAPSSFEFTVFSDLGSLRYLFFCLCLLLFMTIISANVVIILSVCLEKSLHQPMYIFICCLSLNSVYGSVGFFPRFLMDLLSDAHLISRPFCFIQLYIINTFKVHEINILTVMAYDRLLAICQPLHYHSKMTLRTVILLLFLAVLHPVSVFSYFFHRALTLPLCRNTVNRLFCTYWSVVQLSCVDTTVVNITAQFISVLMVFVPLLFVLYSYLRILLICRVSSSDFRGKALQTCLPHIVTFVNYCISVCIELSISLYTENDINTAVIAILSVEYLVIPPISNPLVYGLNLPQIREVIVRFLKMHRLVAPLL